MANNKVDNNANIDIAAKAAEMAANHEQRVNPVREFFGAFVFADYEVRQSKAGNDYEQYYLKLLNVKNGNDFNVFVPRYIAQAAAAAKPGDVLRVKQELVGKNEQGFNDWKFYLLDSNGNRL